ncbi:hypothetical protein FQZ97_1175240 [compost metagenome]
MDKLDDTGHRGDEFIFRRLTGMGRGERIGKAKDEGLATEEKRDGFLLAQEAEDALPA